jgi:ribose 5-phosphate isomerase B
MRIAIGSDHLGYPLKESVKGHLGSLGLEVVDFGTHDEVPVDYPDIAEAVARAVGDGQFGRAILICGTGIGMAIAANKVQGVRAATVADPYSAERARKSNNAQVLCLGSQVTGVSVALILVDHWLAAEFQGGGSARKVEKIGALESRTKRDGVSPLHTP